MKHLSPGDRPREKLLRLGAGALGDNELLAVVLGSGCRRADALTLANEILQARGGLHRVASATPGDLARVGGVGPVKAGQVLAALELGRRTVSQAPCARLHIRSPRDAAALLDEQLKNYPRDARLYGLQAKGYASLGKRLLQHQAQAEAYLLQGSLPAAIEQLQLAQKSGEGDFYQLSSVEARLRDLRQQLEQEKKEAKQKK